MDDLGDYDYVGESPSIRREWIEIRRIMSQEIAGWVSLHTEGVD